MKKVLSILVAIFIASSMFAQVSVENLKYSEKDSVWTKDAVTLWNNFSGINPYAKLMKISDVKGEDVVKIYHIDGITKSRKMVTDTATGIISAEYPEQWMISYKSNGKIVAFVTYDDPTDGGADITANSVVELMSAGLHQGDDETTNATSENDEKFSPASEENLEIPDDF